MISTMLQVFNGTEANPEFASDIRATLEDSGKKGAVLVCNIGGSLTPTQANALGRQSRSALISLSADQNHPPDVLLTPCKVLAVLQQDVDIGQKTSSCPRKIFQASSYA